MTGPPKRSIKPYLLKEEHLWMSISRWIPKSLMN